MERTKTINNGVNPHVFFKDNSKRKELKEQLKIEKGEKVILFPHRPEKSKGIKECLDLLKGLLEDGFRARLLFPRYIDYRCNEETREDYLLLKRMLNERDLSKNVSFFYWKPFDKMRHIYSLANVTLNVGNFVESFGLVPLESLLCGTPVIATKAGALRYNLPSNTEAVKIIEYGDYLSLKKNVINLFNGRIDFTKVHSYIKKILIIKKC